MIGGRNVGGLKLGGRKKRIEYEEVEDTRTEAQKDKDFYFNMFMGCFCTLLIIFAILAAANVF